MMSTDFRHYANQSHPKPGEIWGWDGFNARVYCLMTQEGALAHDARPGRATTANVNHCLHHLQRQLIKDEVASLAIPRLATGKGGLDWDKVSPLIQHHLASLSIPIYVYSRYERDVQAIEPGVS